MADIEYVTLDMSSICRVCLIQEGKIPIFGKEKSVYGYSLPTRIMSFACVEIFEGDGLPSQICQKCLKQVNRAFKFKALCEYSDATLRQYCTELSGKSEKSSVTEVSEGDQNDEGAPVSQIDSSTVARVINSGKVVIKQKKGAKEPVSAELSAFLQEASDYCESSFFILDSDMSDEIVQQYLTKDEQETEDSLLIFEEGELAKTENEGSENDMKCELCSKVFSNEAYLRAHLRRHEASGEFACGQCGKVFPQKGLLLWHERLHSGNKPYICSFCGKTFLRISNLNDHEKRHRGLKRYLCNHCGKLAGGKKDHYCQVLHGKAEKIYPCDICGKKFAKLNTLGTHKKRHGTEEKFMCKECGKQFFSNQELERHLRVHMGIRPFICSQEDCCLTFYTQGELNRHMRYHNGEKKFSCEICGQKFFESGHLTNHRRKHTGERPFRCLKCPKSFMDRSKLNRHARTHVTVPQVRISRRQNPSSMQGKDQWAMQDTEMVHNINLSNGDTLIDLNDINC